MRTIYLYPYVLNKIFCLFVNEPQLFSYPLKNFVYKGKIPLLQKKHRYTNPMIKPLIRIQIQGGNVLMFDCYSE